MDAHNKEFYNSIGLKSKIDILQFVRFNKFENNRWRLSEEVLEKISGQIQEYFRIINIQPKAQIIDI